MGVKKYQKPDEHVAMQGGVLHLVLKYIYFGSRNSYKLNSLLFKSVRSTLCMLLSISYLRLWRPYLKTHVAIGCRGVSIRKVNELGALYSTKNATVIIIYHPTLETLFRPTSIVRSPCEL